MAILNSMLYIPIVNKPSEHAEKYSNFTDDTQFGSS